jgi:3-polyprenyl-4-hydroxybenzoate decarboxylase
LPSTPPLTSPLAKSARATQRPGYVDIFNLADVMWAVATRTRADRDLIFVHRAMGAILDPSSDPVDNTLTKVGVDATKPNDADFAQRLTIAEEQRTRVRSILSAAGVWI